MLLKVVCCFLLVISPVPVLGMEESGDGEKVPFSFVGEASGPFQSVYIQKIVDESEGVVCYIYMPKKIWHQTHCEKPGEKMSCDRFPQGDIGDISCVKR